MVSYGCPLHVMHNNNNGSQSLAKGGAKNLWVKFGQPQIQGYDGLLQGPVNLTDQIQNYNNIKFKTLDASKVNNHVHE